MRLEKHVDEIHLRHITESALLGCDRFRYVIRHHRWLPHEDVQVSAIL